MSDVDNLMIFINVEKTINSVTYLNCWSQSHLRHTQMPDLVTVMPSSTATTSLTRGALFCDDSRLNSGAVWTEATTAAAGWYPRLSPASSTQLIKKQPGLK